MLIYVTVCQIWLWKLANSVNGFKACLDKCWLHQEVMFDFTAEDQYS